MGHGKWAAELLQGIPKGHLPLSPRYWGAVGALVRDSGTLFPLQRQQLRLLDHLPSLMAPDTLLPLVVLWHMVAACQQAGP